ncbi:MAG: YfcE family phosphodiesterase [Kiritimatiellae bacterium]|jgi:putative phosphoesterase|nr:YfcE family phosphodiesterase [Kiritimatiellia bacterium]NLD89774.1 YfcE family phosphodiesterase [Lentisphaerota bacterium]HPC19044.1 YfcE family phosphodiesterase [Kiritimatiellia bacterium]HQQ60839.1 YfcE family phosphodiesterase [Kiritimatiellia bacterium]
MRLGILSDTHNRLPETRRALDLLMRHGAEHLIHCGDAGEDVIDLLSATCQEHGIRAHVAIGNCDRRHLEDLPFQPAPAGIERSLAPEFLLAGKRCIVLHGDNATHLDRVTASGRFDYVFTGHTHASADRFEGATRVVNPGSPVHSRSGPPRVAVLDLDTGHVTWIEV